MPLVKSKSPAAVGENIKTEEAVGKPYDQAVAIALSVQDKAKARKNVLEAAQFPAADFYPRPESL